MRLKTLSLFFVQWFLDRQAVVLMIFRTSFMLENLLFIHCGDKSMLLRLTSMGTKEVNLLSNFQICTPDDNKFHYNNSFFSVEGKD